MKFLNQETEINFQKGLIPVIVQDSKTNKVLMLGYMNQEAYKKTIEEKKVTFYSRSKKRLWTKGEVSKNYLLIKDVLIDCDKDSLLIKAEPKGPICHKGTDTCWKESNRMNFLFYLENLISNRINKKYKNSYVFQLFKKGINRISQKLGEEAVEMIIESKDNNSVSFLNESADLLFHYLILLHSKGFTIQDVINFLEKRHIN
ncbi:MAG: bifunctional phosphoribosyl-AMP cyclohydrolase/phosphoribosyl-ATP diphosphatase HisIE [Flavobacteriales bacterium]|jgi:phosphoribosyl-ATP pyrophosphohydrolase/phosphoribosyl-AMP cyclohydrolase|uniref:bifunctional phosphoribosyl-AMP cyclohydrolase/phosphoribosyl-ATP diphosphatase HisIE n=1 Tax=Blattabacterium sp. (Mastotermes darwiniensis) TaxID=39768 RepID=UPI000231DFC8|nr:bifunctional phosphoribosyl-AMP cyclohydrolase/phosphoribosyl-ATP diphosphatase HisIE [Blattabacterium sp. (Mastotermes darwiniensis)]AER40480.1 bifunctional imidazole glycerol-phosphate dehydratase/histidinol phosphatase [Blattabacterium sp. (Mastotermes darwiniensis) str. MADAR]MDR1805005.1 bifunctional phosphoribosyl-AMP cyclohydrolase/phosphoribosyl-ATP diphosphatase HisIE [Flavobacteriales bacterium]